MSEKRRGLGRGLGALIPSNPPVRPEGERPVDDVFFREPAEGRTTPSGGSATSTALLERSGLSVDRSSVETEPGDRTTAPQTSDGAGQAPENAAAAIQESSTVQDDTQDDVAADQGGAPEVVAEVRDAQSDLVPVPGARFAEIPIASIRPNARQPRQVFDEEDLAELVMSIKEIGILQPIVVRELAEPDDDGATFELVMGERRWRASTEAGLASIPAIVRETGDDDMLRDALLENLHRSQLNPLEEGAAYQQLLDDFGCTHEELAARIGRSRPQISNMIRLLRLPPQVQRRVAAGVLSAGHARALLGLESGESMEALAQRIVSEGLSVRAVEEVVALGDVPVPSAKKRPRAGGHRTELDDLAGRLGDTLDTRVSIQLGQRKGRLNIDFASVDDLNRILSLMSPAIRGAFSESDLSTKS